MNVTLILVYAENPGGMSEQVVLANIVNNGSVSVTIDDSILDLFAVALLLILTDSVVAAVIVTPIVSTCAGYDGTTGSTTGTGPGATGSTGTTDSATTGNGNNGNTATTGGNNGNAATTGSGNNGNSITTTGSSTGGSGPGGVVTGIIDRSCNWYYCGTRSLCVGQPHNYLLVCPPLPLFFILYIFLIKIQAPLNLIDAMCMIHAQCYDQGGHPTDCDNDFTNNVRDVFGHCSMFLLLFVSLFLFLQLLLLVVIGGITAFAFPVGTGGITITSFTSSMVSH